MGLVRVSKGCHRKFRGHNFESCVTNFDKISFFSLRSRYGKFRGFHPSYYKIRSVSDLQNPTATPLTQAGAAHRGTRLSAAHTITMSLFYQTITRPVPSLSGACVLCVPRGGKWSGEWQISKNFGACGASGKFFSKFRETLTNPNSCPRLPMAGSARTRDG